MANSTREVSLGHNCPEQADTSAKVLGVENVILLSEVHPNKRGEDIRKQCLKNYQIVIPSGLILTVASSIS